MGKVEKRKMGRGSAELVPCPLKLPRSENGANVTTAVVGSSCNRTIKYVDYGIDGITLIVRRPVVIVC